MKGSETCQACARLLSRSQWRANDMLKSCPRCSSANGREHVFHRHPEAFGETSARASAADPEGSQSWCTACRGRMPPGGGRRCSEL